MPNDNVHEQHHMDTERAHQDLHRVRDGLARSAENAHAEARAVQRVDRLGQIARTGSYERAQAYRDAADRVANVLRVIDSADAHLAGAMDQEGPVLANDDPPIDQSWAIRMEGLFNRLEDGTGADITSTEELVDYVIASITKYRRQSDALMPIMEAHNLTAIEQIGALIADQKSSLEASRGSVNLLEADIQHTDSLLSPLMVKLHVSSVASLVTVVESMQAALVNRAVDAADPS